MNKLRKTISVFLISTMILPLLPTTAWAAADIRLEIIPHTFTYMPDFSGGMAAAKHFFSEGMAVVEQDGKRGYIDESGKIVIQPQYDHAWKFSEGMAAVKLDGKWGFIDKSGKIIVQPKYDYVEDFRDGMVVVKLNGKYGFVDKSGKETVPPKYSRVGGRVIVSYTTTDGNKGSPLNVPIYNSVYFFQHGLIAVWLDDKCGFVDKLGNEVIPLKYSDARPFYDEMAAVKLGEKWGFIDKYGKEVIPPKYDDVKNFSDGMAAVKLNDKWGLIDKTGNAAVPVIYYSITYYPNGIAFVELEQFSKKGVIDRTGKEVMPFIFNGLTYVSEDLFRGSINGKYGFYDKSGKEIAPPVYTDAREFYEGMAAVKTGDKSTGKWGFIDETGKEIVPPIYDNVQSYSEGMAAAELNEKWGFIDKTGYVVIPFIYDSTFSSKDGLTLGVKSYSEGAAAVKIDGKWGFIDAQGNVIVPPAYDYVSGFRNGLSWAMIGEKHEIIIDGRKITATTYKSAVINKNGEELTPVKYSYDVYEYPALVSNAVNVLEHHENGSDYYDFCADLIKIIEPPVDARPAESTVIIDGQKIVFATFSIEGSEYFRINDLAYALNGTSASFSKEIVNNDMVLTKGGAYISTEKMSAKGTEIKKAVPGRQGTVVLNPDYKWTGLSVYNIGGYNYVKLSDFAEVMGLESGAADGGIVISAKRD